MDVNSRDPSQNIIPFRIKGVEVGRFDICGNLGIGTSTPIARLDVSGNARISGELYVDGFELKSLIPGVVVNMDSQPAASTALNRQKKQSIPLSAASTLSTSDIVAKMSGVSVGKTQSYGVGASQMASYGNIVVAVGEGTNSIAYSLANPPTASSWVGIPNSANTFTSLSYNIAYANGTWVAVGGGTNHIAYSTSTPPVASSWVGIPSGTFNGVTNIPTDTVRNIAYGNGVWVAVGGGHPSIAYSLANPPTAESWVGIPYSPIDNVYGITFGNGTWVVSGYGGLSYSTQTPPTANSWVSIPNNTLNDAGIYIASTEFIRRVIYANGVWLACGVSTNSLCYSVENPPIAGSWMPITTSALFGNAGRSIAYGNGIWVACGDSNTLFAYSTSRIPHSSSWVSMKGPTPSSSGELIFNITFNAATNTWYFMGDIGTNCMFYSTATPPVPATWVGVQRSTGAFTVEAYGAVGITTNAFTSPVNVARLDNKVTFPANRMLAVGGGGGSGGAVDVLARSSLTPAPAVTGTISYSDDDGATWQMVPGGATNAMFSSPADIAAGTTSFGVGGSRGANAVAWNGEKWVAAGNGRTHSLAFSDDGGMTWTGITGKSVFSVEARDVAWNGQMWVAVGRGVLFSTAYSYDGVTWMGPVTDDVNGTPINVFSYDIAGPTAATSDISGGGNHVIWTGKMWVATGTRTLIAGSSPAAYYTIAYSLDGKSWTGVAESGATSTGFDMYAHGVAWNGRNYIATGRGTTNTLAFSTDIASSWQGLGNTVFSVWGRGITWGARRWMATGRGTNTVAYSTNGRNWQGCGANVFKPLRRFMAMGDTGLYTTVASGQPQRGVAVSYSDDGVTWDAPVVNQGVEFKTTRFLPNAFYVRTGGSNWRDFIPLLTANSTTNLQNWGPDAQFHNVSSAPQNEIAVQFSYFAGYWLNANRAMNGQSFSVFASFGTGGSGTFTFTATSNYPVTSYTGSLSNYTSNTTYTLTPQTDGINAGIINSSIVNPPYSIFTNQFILTNAITDNASQHTGLMYSSDGGASWARVPGTSDISNNGGTEMTVANSGAFSLAMNTARTRFFLGGGDAASATRKAYFSNDGFNWRNGISSPNTSQMAWVYASLWVGGGYNRWLIGGNDVAANNANGRIMYSGDAESVAAWLAASPATYTGTVVSCFAANPDFSVILAGTASGNVIYRSVNGGANWETVSISSTTLGNIRSIAFSPSLGRWVAVGGAASGANNTIIYSTDATGNTWAVSPQGVRGGATALFKVGSEVTRVIWDAVGGGRFIIGGWNGGTITTMTNVAGLESSTNNNPGYTMAYSADGINWTPVTVGLDNGGGGVAAGAGAATTTTAFGPFLTHCREIMALDMSGDFTPINTGYSVTWNSYANRFIATGNGTTPVVYSSDGGVTWTPANQQPQQQAIVVAGGVSGTSGSSTTASPITYSMDGKTWHQGIGAKEIFGSSGFVTCVKYGQTSTAISPNGRIWVAGGQPNSGTSCLAFSQNGVRWTAITSGTTMMTNVRAIAYAPLEQLASGASGASGASASSGIGNGIWVAGGDTTNSLAFSYDGISWSEVPNSLTILSRCNACTFGNGLFVAGGVASTSGAATAIDSTANMCYSTDGINWKLIRGSSARIASGTSIGCITYGRDETGRGLWVAGAVGSTTISILYSYNGIDWIGVPSSGTNLSASVTGVAYGVSAVTGQGVWIASVYRSAAQGNYSFISSSNGRDGWTAVANTKAGLFDSNTTGATGISYLNGVWYATGISAGISAGRTLAYSYEGTGAWFGVYPTSMIYGTSVATFSATDMRCVATTADYMIPVGSSAGSTTSTGMTAAAGTPSSLSPVRNIAWTAGVGSAYLQHPTLLFGTDNTRTATRTATATAISADGGRTWGSSTVSLAHSAFRGGICNDAFWNGSIWVAVGYDATTGAKVAKSKDGLTWTQIPGGSIPIVGVLYSIMWNGRIWMVGGDGSPTNDANTCSIAWSYDLTDWYGITNTDTKLTVVKRIAWNGMYWVAVGAGDVSTIMHSKDTRGLVWEDTFMSSVSLNKTAAVTTAVNDIVWGGGRWVAVGRGNSVGGGSGVCILYSTDTPVNGGTPADYAITGRRWTGVIGSAQLFPYGVNSVSWNGKRFVATGPASGTYSTGNIIAWSPDGITWTAYSTAKTFAPGQRWVAVGSGSRACIGLSADGRVWTDISGSALLFADISGASTTLASTMKTGARAIGWNSESLVIGGARSATTVTATSQSTATATTGRTTIPVYAFIGSGNGVMGGGTTNAPMGTTEAAYLRVSSSVFVTHFDVNMREGSAPWANMWLNTYTDLSGTVLFQVTPETQSFSSAIKWNGWSWVANFGMTTTTTSITSEQFGSIWYCTDPLARVGWSVASNSLTSPRILIGQGGYAALEWNGVAWLACGYDPNNNNLIYTTDKYGAIGWTAVSGIVSGAGSASFQPVCIASSSRVWVVGGSQGTTSALYYTSDRTGATGWRAVVSSVLPGIRITSVGYNGTAWICCGGGGGGSGAPASSISWRADTGAGAGGAGGDEVVGSGWAAATLSGTSGGIPPVMSGSSAIAYNAGAASPIWIVVGDVTSTTNDQIAFTSTVNGSTEWKKPTTGTLTSTTFGRLTGIVWTGYSWIATSGAGFSRLAATDAVTAATSWNNSTNSFYTPTLCTNAVAYADIPISLLTTGMPTSAGAGAGTGAMWRGGVGRAQGLLGGGGAETTSVVVRSSNGAEGTSWSQVYSRNFLIAVGGAVIRDANGGGGANRMAYSYDGGLSWTTNTTTVLTSATQNSVGSIRTVKYGNGMWVAGGDSSGSGSSGGNCLAWSRDGVNWTGAGGTQIFGRQGACYAVCCNDRGRWVAVGGAALTTAGTYTNTSGAIYTMAWSDDGMNWTPVLGSRALFGIVCQGVSYGADASGVGMWTAIGRGSAYTGCAYSYDGKTWYLSQTSGSLFGTSANVLTERYAPVAAADWRSVSLSSTGQYQTVIVYGGNIHTSSDYGVTWTPRTTPGSLGWFSVSLSSTGQYQTVVENGGNIHTSSDYGVTWTPRTTPGSLGWVSVSLSSTGQYQTVMVYGGNIHTSSDYGVNWTPRTTPGSLYWYSVSLSSTGQYQTAVMYVGSSKFIHTSSDYGVNWTPRTTPGSLNWFSVSLSSTGQYQTVVENGGNIHTSLDYGVNWTPRTTPGSLNWQSVSISSTGQYQTAVVGGGLIYISSNFGETWSATANDSRSLSVVYGKDASGVGMWVATAGRRDRDVAASVANTMAYSYDGKLWRGIRASACLSEQAWSVAYGKDGFGVGMWVAAGYDTVCGLKWSYDGVTWNASTGASGAAVWASAAAGRRALCVYWNGSMWLASTSDTRNGEPSGTGIAANNASGVPGYLLYSYNGKNWLPVLAPNTYASTISSTAQPSVYSVLPNPAILDFGSFYDDQGQRGATIANTTATRRVGAVMSGGLPIENISTIVPYGRGSVVTGQMPLLLGGDSGLMDTAAGVVGIAGAGAPPPTSEIAAATTSLSTSVDGGITWRAVPNSTRVMTKVNKILCDETTQQIVAVGTGNYSVATSTPAKAADADGWTGVFGSRMTDTQTGLFERFGTGAAWFAGAKMWVASGRAQSRRGSSLAVSVNGTVWQDAKIVSAVTAGSAGMGRGGGLVGRTITSGTTTSSNAYDNFISGPTAQSTNNNWQYFEVNENRTGATLLSNWQNGNPVISTYGQWDNDKTSGNYPFIQKVTASGALTSSIGGYPFTGPALIMHPDDSNANNIGLGYKNITTNTINVSIDINLSLLFPGVSGDGINYHIQRELVNSPRYTLFASGSILNGDSAIYRFNNTIELQSGEFVYVILNRRAGYGFDHTRVDFNVNIISQVNTNTVVPYTSATTPLLTYTDSAVAFSTQVGGIAVNSQYNRAVVGGSGVQFVAGGRGGSGGGGLTVSNDGQTWVAGGASASAVFQTPTNATTRTGSGGFDASFGTVALTQRLTTPATYPSGTFNGIVVNETGQYQTAIINAGALFTSSDYGVNWTQRDQTRAWNRLSMSSSGQYQTAVVGFGLLYSSWDFGTTWTSRATANSGVNTNWNGVSVSSTGQYQTVVVDGGTLWTSSDYGLTWATRASTATWNHVSLSSTGQYQTAVVRAGFVSASSDYGVSWATRDISRNWVAVSISSTGQYQTALVGDGFIYTSFNFGTTWTARLTDTGRNWTWAGLSVSSTGQYQSAVVYSTTTFGYIYISSDYGVNWTPRMTDAHRNWGSISVSGSGQYQSAAFVGGTIYTSSDYGITWVNRSTATRTNAFTRVRSSASGQYQIATSGPVGNANGQFYVSSDYGQSWIPRRGLATWLGGAVSASGAVMMVAASYSSEETAPVFNGYHRITLGNKTAWNSILSNITVECWFRTIDTGNQGTYATMVSRWYGGDTTDSQFGIGMGNFASNKITFSVVTNTAGLGVTSPLSYNDTLWHHAAGTYSSTTKTVSLYIDGVLVASSTNASAGSLTNISTPLIIGSDNRFTGAASDRDFRGAISDVRIWNVARSASEIANSYQIRLNGNESGLAGYWKLDQPTATGYPGTVTAFRDSSVNANHSESINFSGVWNTRFIPMIRSTDYGTTFSNVSGTALTGSAYWQSIAMTNSGAVQSAVAYGGSIYRSLDTGVTWSNAGITIDGSTSANTGTPRNWQDIAVAAETGAVQVTCVSGGYLYVSTNTGATWVSASVNIDGVATQTTNRAWRAVAVSANGQYGLACVNSTSALGLLYRSVNSGTSWVSSSVAIDGVGTQMTNRAWQDVGMSANGKYQVACVGTSGSIFYSKDYGASWTSLTTAGSRAWSSVSISENGSTISATTNDASGGVWTYAMPDEQYYRPATLANVVGGGSTVAATIRAVAYGNSGVGSAVDGYWLAGGDASGNTLAYSSNGVDWTAVVGSKTTLFNAVNGVAYGVDALGAPMWVAVGVPFVGSVPGATAYSIAYSYNMTTWVGVRNAANFTGQGNHVAFGQDEYGAGVWVAVGQSDGSLAANLGDSTFGNSNGNTGATIFYSYDGANWAAGQGAGVFSTSGTDVTWGVDASGVATWVATGVGFTDPVSGIFTAGGQVAHSVNGRVWTPISIRTMTAISPTLPATTLPATSRASTMIVPPGSTGFITPTYSNIWRMLGADIDGEAAFDQSGYSVSLSADGTVVAIGAYTNDGTGNNAGHVRVYKYNANKTVAQTNQSLAGFGPIGWDRLGADIDGEAASDQSGWSVSLSADGTVVAIGAYLNGGTGSYAGHVRVYKYNPNKTVAQTNQSLAGFGPIGWDRLGADIDGEAADDYSGWSVSLSADGTVVAIGATGNDGTGSVAGHVRVYKYNPNKTVAQTNQSLAGFGPIGWDRLGADIDGEAAGDSSGRSVSLSSDGTVVAIGADYNDGTGSDAGHVRVYKYNPNKTVAQINQSLPGFGPIGWDRLGADIDGEAATDQSGQSVSLSADGTTVAIGAFGNDGTGTSAGHVRVYKIDTLGAITYTSSNPAVAEIYGNTILFIKDGASGSTTITATQSATPPLIVEGTLTVSGTVYTFQYINIFSAFTIFTGDAGAAALTVAYGRAGSQGSGAPLWIVGGSGGTNVFARSSRPSAVTAGTWTVTASNATAGAAPFPICNSLGYSNGVWVAGNNTDATNILARSVDGGATWTPITASSMSGILAGATAMGANAFCNYSLAVADFSNDTNLRSWVAVQGTKNFFFEGGVSAVATVTPDISAAVYGGSGGGGSGRAWWVAGGVGLSGVASLGYTTDPSGATGWTKAASTDIANLSAINAVAFSPFTQRWLAVGAGATESPGTNILYSDASGVTWTSTSVATAATPVITLHTCVWNQLPTPATVSNTGRWLVGGTRNDGGINNVTVANSASVYISTDVSGIATPWTPVAGTGAILSQVYSLAYNGRVWIAAGVRATGGGGGGSTSTLMRTTDPTGASGWVGITATNTSVDGFDTAARSITWNPADGGMWIATGENTATTGSSMIYSLDISGGAGTWRSVREANSICFSGEGTGLAYTGDRWFAVGDGNRAIVATTGTGTTGAAMAATATWSPVSHGTSITRATDIAYTGRRLIATGSGAGSTTGVILSTDNTGASWSTGASTGFSDALGGGTSVAFEASYDGVGRVVATGRSATNVLSVSADGGSTWSTSSTQFSSANTVETTTQPLFTTGANSVAYVGNDTLFGIGGNDVHWTGKRWVAVGRNTADISGGGGGGGAVTVTAAGAPGAALPIPEIINNNTTPLATSDDGITWQCVRMSQAPNLSEGVFVATNSRIGSTPLIDSQILIADGGDTEQNTDYGGMVGGVGGFGTGICGIDIIAEITPVSHAAHSIGAVGIIGAAGNGGANSVGNASTASFDTTAFTITPRPLPRVN